MVATVFFVAVASIAIRSAGLGAPALRGQCRTGVLRGGASSAAVEVYTTPGCSYCRKAKSLLKRLSVQYDEIDVSESADARSTMEQRAGGVTVPQIFVGDDHVGGATELLSEHETGALAARFSAANIAFSELLAEPEPAAAVASVAVDASAGPVDGVLNPAANDDDDEKVASTANGAAAISSALQKRMLRLLDEHLSEDGNRVDYAALRTSAAFAEFRDAVGALRSLPTDALAASAPLAERKAFWVNLYNVLVLHATAVLGAPEDAAARGRFFNGAAGAAYCVGGLNFCLDDIEHGVLRANAPTVGGATLFGEGDARRALSLPGPADPRLHFALNCGARSCPPIKFYAADDLDDTLSLSARAFLEADLEVDVTAGTLTCTKLLDWYSIDFGATPAALVERVRAMLPAGSALDAALGGLLQREGGPLLVFKDYDWGSNGEE